ncbi:hypothetical protein N7497_004056 [Penicillium chrysogenum]|jgi:hypothetical protein|uniref:Uncharacterized protein n=1 Tax=Penicillium chrysogenum TaxID=5076 RepID=A0ABQ8W9W3_PENCH|nr:hypothetical protein N7505_008460 [Penicillium chrysogenum]KAJ6159519.1 hypothetical protein N7497_004056 [Penicillium chrysogenum]
MGRYRLVVLKPNEIPSAVANFNDSDLPVIPSARQGSDHAPGYAFRSWRYATATVALVQKHKLTTACLDSGCVMTLIDSRLAKGLAQLGCTETPMAPIPVSGLQWHISDSDADSESEN